MFKTNNDWDLLLKEQFCSRCFSELSSFLEEEYSMVQIYPPKEDIFNALKLTSYENTRVVIIGQDPYHGPGEAHGLAFSVKEGVRLPPSLKNIFKEIKNDLGVSQPEGKGNLTDWATEGVLLLNTVLTVREDKPTSHKNKGWEIFTDKIISLLNEKQTPVVFLLWGNHAIKKAELITNPNHLVLTAVHPSPLSANRGFFGCGHFGKANEFLKASGQKEINWQLKK